MAVHADVVEHDVTTVELRDLHRGCARLVLQRKLVPGAACERRLGQRLLLLCTTRDTRTLVKSAMINGTFNIPQTGLEPGTPIAGFVRAVYERRPANGATVTGRIVVRKFDAVLHVAIWVLLG